MDNREEMSRRDVFLVYEFLVSPYLRGGLPPLPQPAEGVITVNFSRPPGSPPGELVAASE
jgi:hypothetical protein